MKDREADPMDPEIIRRIACLLYTFANDAYNGTMPYEYILHLSEDSRNKLHEAHCEPADLFRVAGAYLMDMAKDYESKEYVNPSIAAIKQLEKECPALYLRIASVTPNSNGLKFTFYNKNGQEDPDMWLDTYKEENENEQ